MSGRQKHIISFILFIVFLFPSGIKLLHHHHDEGSTCAHQIECINVKCDICDYNFVFYPERGKTIPDHTIVLNTFYTFQTYEIFLINFNTQSILLRAPPMNKC